MKKSNYILQRLDNIEIQMGFPENMGPHPSGLCQPLEGILIRILIGVKKLNCSFIETFAHVLKSIFLIFI